MQSRFFLRKANKKKTLRAQSKNNIPEPFDGGQKSIFLLLIFFFSQRPLRNNLCALCVTLGMKVALKPA